MPEQPCLLRHRLGALIKLRNCGYLSGGSFIIQDRRQKCIDFAKLLIAKSGKKINSERQKNNCEDRTYGSDMRRWRIVRQVESAEKIDCRNNGDRHPCCDHKI